MQTNRTTINVARAPRLAGDSTPVQATTTVEKNTMVTWQPNPTIAERSSLYLGGRNTSKHNDFHPRLMLSSPCYVHGRACTHAYWQATVVLRYVSSQCLKQYYS
eukprot:scpid91533/ scgid33026/ 